MTNYAEGLADIVAGKTAISTVEKAGKGLYYRGYAIADLASHASFEEVAYLMLYDKLPNQQELNNYCLTLRELRVLPRAIESLLEQIPRDAHPMDVLRTTCSFLGSIEPEYDFSQQDQVANRLIAMLPSALCYWYHFHQHGLQIETRTNEESFASHFLYLLHNESQPEEVVRAVDTSLVLYAEHEFNASTFSARVTAATLSDFYSAMTSAIGTLRGFLHGGANEAAMALMQRFQSPEEAEQGILDMLTQREKIMGFGHRVYKIQDPRSPIIKDWVRKLMAHRNNAASLFSIAERIEKVMAEQKHLFPNVDFYMGLAYYYCGIPIPMFTPMFVFGRLSGWAAHVIEQRANNRLIRPTADYIGPEPRTFIPIESRI